MIRRLCAHATYANVLSTLTFFIVVAGGTAWAANEWSGANVQDGTLTTLDYKNEDIRAVDVRDASRQGGGLSGAEIVDNSLTGDDIDESSLVGAIGRQQFWTEVAPGLANQDACADPAIFGIFCTRMIGEIAVAPWQNYGRGLATAAFKKDQLGIVHLKGVVARVWGENYNSSVEQWPLFRLPSSMRPQTRRLFPSVGTGRNGSEIVQGRVDVQPNGLVTLVMDCDAQAVNCSADGTDITLDGISFIPEE